MIGALEEYILDCWKDFLPDRKKPNKLSFILLSDLPPHLDLVIFIIIPQNSFQPLFMAKLPRYISDNDKLRRNVEYVCSLKKQLPTHLSCSIPAMVNMTEIDGRLTILEQPVPMPTLGLKLKRSGKPYSVFNKIDGLEIISDWLIDFFMATHHPATQPSLDQRILSSLAQYEDRFSLTSTQKECLDKMRMTLVQEKYIPQLGVMHTNLTPDQVSFDGEQLYIANWESLQEKGLPLLDTFHFISSLALLGVSKVAEAEDRFRLLILSGKNENNLWSRWTRKISSALEIDESTQNLLYLLYLVDRALSWDEFETVENYWQHLFNLYLTWLNQIDCSSSTLKRI
jgi:hypothetical protein